MAKTIIRTDGSPAPIGPYSQAVKIGSFLFTSGQIPADPVSGEIVSGGIEVQARRVLENLGAILKSSGGSFENIVKTTIFLKDMNDFTIVNSVYAGYFQKDPPARSTVEVSRLPKDVRIEIEAIAYI